ncbi:MAG TPA: type II toxin-antitoxin system HicA family toxin [Candidatus Xenobia bacterium]|nr:type II toxin-antitoxin system HicA family toxin [Candidatus Xenobia bacterium]
MKLPRDLSGHELASLPRGFGYQIARQTGSHLRLVRKTEGKEHHVTIPAHRQLKVGTLSGILADVAAHLGMRRDQLVQELFG